MKNKRPSVLRVLTWKLCTTEQWKGLEKHNSKRNKGAVWKKIKKSWQRRIQLKILRTNRKYYRQKFLNMVKLRSLKKRINLFSLYCIASSSGFGLGDMVNSIIIIMLLSSFSSSPGQMLKCFLVRRWKDTNKGNLNLTILLNRLTGTSSNKPVGLLYHPHWGASSETQKIPHLHSLTYKT